MWEEGGWIVIDLLQLIRSCKMHCCYAPPNPGHPAPTAAKDDLHRLHMNFVLFFLKMLLFLRCCFRANTTDFFFNDTIIFGNYNDS